MKNNFVENVGRTLFDQKSGFRITKNGSLKYQRLYAIVVERMKKGEENSPYKIFVGQVMVEMMCVCLWYGFVTTS